MTQLIKIFETIYSDIWVAEVWFLNKKRRGDGYERFHYDYGSSKGGFNAISSMIKVNFGVCHSEDEEEKDKKEAGNTDEEDEDNEDGQVEDSNEAMNERVHGFFQNRGWKLKEWRRLQMKDRSYCLARILRRRTREKMKRLKHPSMRV